MPRGFPSRLEHVPVASYHLLRRLDAASIESATLFSAADRYAVQFLTSRKLARVVGSRLMITPSGRAIGEVGDERTDADAEFAMPSRPGTIGAAGPSVGNKPLSATLLHAADNINQLSTAHILILIRQAARALQLDGEARERGDAANDDAHRPDTQH